MIIGLEHQFVVFLRVVVQGFTVFFVIPDDVKFVCTLDDQSKKKAREELNENEKDRLGAVQSFRSLVLQQDWLRTRTGKIMMKLFEPVHENEKDKDPF